MPRGFDVSTETAASVEAIHAAFGLERYWLDRLVAYGGEAMTLNSLLVDSDGTVSVTTTQDLRHDMLPGPLGKVFGGDLSVRRSETWRRADGGEVHGEVDITTTGAPASGTGTAVLAPVAGGSRLTFAGTVEVRIPLVGGRIENYLGGQIAEEIPGVQAFTTEWIEAHG